MQKDCTELNLFAIKIVAIWRKLQEYVGIPMTGNDLREANESLSMGITMPFSTNEC